MGLGVRVGLGRQERGIEGGSALPSFSIPNFPPSNHHCPLFGRRSPSPMRDLRRVGGGSVCSSQPPLTSLLLAQRPYLASLRFVLPRSAPASPSRLPFGSLCFAPLPRISPPHSSLLHHASPSLILLTTPLSSPVKSKLARFTCPPHAPPLSPLPSPLHAFTPSSQDVSRLTLQRCRVCHLWAPLRWWRPDELATPRGEL